MWAPNIVFGLVGAALLRITAFDRPLVPFRRKSLPASADLRKPEDTV